MKILLYVVLFIFTSNYCANSQVNTESLRNTITEKGLHGSANLGLQFVSGNSEFFRFMIGGRLDYLADWGYLFVVASNDYKEGNTNIIVNRGFSHIRYTGSGSGVIVPEVFAQKEFNQFTKMLDRNVIGANMRMRLIGLDDSSHYRLIIGVGAMYENEKLNEDKIYVSHIPKSTNYISFTARFSNEVRFRTVNYFQAAATRISDRRILSNTFFDVNLGRIFVISFGFNYVYDNEPPKGVRNYDFEFNNSFSVRF